MKKILAGLFLFLIHNSTQAWVQLSDGSYVYKEPEYYLRYYADRTSRMLSILGKEGEKSWCYIMDSQRGDEMVFGFKDAWEVFLRGADHIQFDVEHIGEENFPSEAPWLK